MAIVRAPTACIRGVCHLRSEHVKYILLTAALTSISPTTAQELRPSNQGKFAGASAHTAGGMALTVEWFSGLNSVTGCVYQSSLVGTEIQTKSIGCRTILAPTFVSADASPSVVGTNTGQLNSGISYAYFHQYGPTAITTCLCTIVFNLTGIKSMNCIIVG